MPEGLATAHCVRCGGVMTETNITTKPTAVHPGIPTHQQQREPLFESEPTYQTWDDFRLHSPAVQRALTDLAMRPIPNLERLQVLDLPERAEHLADEFGELVASVHKQDEKPIHHIGIPILVWLALLLAALCMIPIGMIGRAHGDPDAFSFSLFFGFLSLVTLPVVIWYVFIRQGVLDRIYWVFDQGVLCQRGNKVEKCRWENMRDFRVNRHGQNTIYWITVMAEVRDPISILDGEHAIRLMEMIEVKLLAARFLPTLRLVYEGNKVRFGAITLDLSGFSGPGFFAPWYSIHRIATDSDGIFIDCGGQSVIQTVEYKKISFPSVLLAVAQILIEEADRLAPSSE